MKKVSFLVLIIMMFQLFPISAMADCSSPDSLVETVELQTKDQIHREDGNFSETEGALTEAIGNETINFDQLGPVASTNATVWATTNKATNLVSAPYDDINTTIASLASGSGFYIIERDYEYFYVYRVVNGKNQRGYVKMSDVNYSSYSWCSHNIFEKGVTKFTASSQEVLSGPGTTNSYEHIGSIYQNESPLLVLRTELNTYNNVTYCFIQYRVTSTGKFKRGWVPYSAISVEKASSDDSLIDTNKIFYFESAATGKMIQATSTTSGSTVLQQPKKSSNSQLFKIEKASTGYYRFVLQSNTALSLQVIGNQMAEGAQLGIYTKGATNAPSKAEEFEVTVNSDGSFHLKSRCTGRYRAIDLYGGSAANGTNIISSKNTNASNQRWNLQPKILGGSDIAIIKVGDSTGRACASIYSAFSNKNVYYANRENLASTTNVSKNTNFAMPHVKFAIKNSSFFYINGHGYPDPKIKGPNSKYDITPSNIGFSTTDRTRWGVLGPCDQLNETGSAVEWANQALRKGVRGLLGYYETAPHDNGEGDDPQVEKMEEFVSKIGNGTSFVSAWKNANNGVLGIYNESTWAAIYHEAAEGDKLTSYNAAVSSPATTTIYYVGHKNSEDSLSTASINELNTTIATSSMDSDLVQTSKTEWNTINGKKVYEKNGYDIVKTSPVTINQSLALNKVGLFMRENDIVLDGSSVECGTITRSRLSDDGTCFVDEEVLAHTFTVRSVETNGESSANMYFEVTDSGVVNFISAS